MNLRGGVLAAAVVAGVAGVVWGAVGARAESAGRLLACVQERYGRFADLSARFEQESRVAALGRPRTRTGSIFFRKGGLMRWEYDAPDRQLLVADGKQVWFYRPEQKQAVLQKIDAAFTRQTPLLFLFGRGDFGAEFTWEDEKEPAPAPGVEGAVSVALRPRRESPDLVQLHLAVVPGDCRLAGTTLEDAFGNVTRLVFNAERANTGLDASLFRFSPPPGTEVVRP